MVKNWDKYKNLEYYDHLCGSGCGNRIKVKPGQKYWGITKYCCSGHSKRRRSPTEDWEQYKDLEYYSDRFCACGCGGRIKVRSSHEWDGIPKYINGHNSCSPTKQTREKISKAKKGMKFSKEAIEKMSKSHKQLWQDPEYVEKQRKSRNIKPNKPEKFLDKLLQKLFPNLWKYVGDFQKGIGGRNPDFININGQKKIIEFFGNFWHGKKRTGISNEQHEQERIAYFAKYGYQTLVIWEPELQNLDLLIEKITHFHSL